MNCIIQCHNYYSNLVNILYMVKIVPSFAGSLGGAVSWLTPHVSQIHNALLCIIIRTVLASIYARQLTQRGEEENSGRKLYIAAQLQPPPPPPPLHFLFAYRSTPLQCRCTCACLWVSHNSQLHYRSPADILPEERTSWLWSGGKVNIFTVNRRLLRGRPS